MTEQLNQMLDWLWLESVKFVPMVTAWIRYKPQNVDDYLEVFKIALYFGAVMAGIGFAQLGANPIKVLYDRTHAVAEGKFWGPLWKLVLFVFGEDYFYRGLGITGIVYLFDGNEYAILACAFLISIACGFLPPHHNLPVQTRIAVIPGVFFLSLIYLKCGGWENTWPYVNIIALAITTLVHLPPVLILTAAYEYARRKQPPNDTPRPS